MVRAHATLKDVARRAGVSIPTVSTVLNNARGNTVVSSETRQRILSVAKELNYRPNHQARVLKTGRANAIGLLLDPPTHDEMNDAWLRAYARGAELQARAIGYDFMVIGATRNQTVLDRGAIHASQGKVDALLSPGSKPSLHDFDWRHLDVPMVLLGEDRYSTGLPHVVCDETPGHQALVAHLAGLGHRNLLWLGLDRGGRDIASLRLASLHRFVRQAGLSIVECRMPAGDRNCNTISGQVSYFREHFRRMLARSLPAYTAIITYNDLVALGAMQALWSSGRRIPQDVAVASFDDIFARLGHPALTSVSLSLAGIGSRSVDLTMEIASSGKPLEKFRGYREVVPASLVIRDSTGNSFAARS